MKKDVSVIKTQTITRKKRKVAARGLSEEDQGCPRPGPPDEHFGLDGNTIGKTDLRKVKTQHSSEN